MSFRLTALCAAMSLASLASAATTATANYPTWDGKQETVRYATPDEGAALRSYTQATTMRVREGGKQQVGYQESAALPTVRSGSLAFDALFALAGVEMKQDSVSEIRDGSYNGGDAIPCECFETGELWHYVWTRDLSYAASLGLGMLDPQRVRNSLLFKLSGYRDGVKPGAHVAGSADGLQIIQDTGSGGSWPVSTDRISWAFGADEALKALAPQERAAFATTALKALTNTLENDRIAVYDRADGLYNGEESFLDWRDQSYAAWIPGELASMAMSKALSTNAGHYKALTLAAQLAAEQGDKALADKYTTWAADLKRAINRRFWQADTGMYSSLTAGHFDGAPLYKYDWLGQSLAIVTGIADERQAQSILAHYPHGPLGAPVIYPQQAGTAVYHNRAMWPFVTAYGLKAAAMHGNVAVADAAYDTLMRGAALNLSNMENLEWLSGQPMLEDKRNVAGKQVDLSGPVVNSRRQLWSVGAYLGMVVGEVFGVQTTDSGIALRPFVTAKLRREAFAGTDVATLNNLTVRGKRMRVRLLLPAAAPSATHGYYAVDKVTLNGKAAGPSLDWSALADDNVIEIQLGKLLPGHQEKREVRAKPLVEDPSVYAPSEPRIVKLERGTYGFPTLHIAYPGAGKGVVFNIYRNGTLATQRLTSSKWADRRAPRLDKEGGNLCYAVEAMYAGSGNRSHHSAPACLETGVDIGVGDSRVQSSIPATGGRIAGWGAPADKFAVRDIKVARDGNYAAQIRYRNNAHQINLGISGGVKWLSLKDGDGNVVAGGVVQLPHSPEQAGPSYSTPIRAALKAGSYRLELEDHYNMTYLKSNTTYSDAGGVNGPSNKFDIHGVRVMPVAPEAKTGADTEADAGAHASAAPAGAIRIVENFASPQLGNSRNLRIYLPPDYDSSPQRRYPVLYMHDGQNLFDAKTASYGVAWDVGATMDRLIADGAIESVIVVGIDNTKDRMDEYTPCCDPKHGGGKIDAYMAFVVDTVKPWADANLRTLPGRDHTAIMGSSLGGLASVYIAQRHPEIFSKAAGVSGSFWWNDDAFVKNVPARQPVKFYLDAGSKKDGIDHVLKMRDAMLAQGYKLDEDLYFYESPDGVHNEKSWAARVHLPLTWFFGAKK